MLDFKPELLKILKTKKNVLITTHVHPDGDAAGSMLGLAASLRKNGARVDMALSTEIGERFTPFFQGEDVLKPGAVGKSYDLAVILDIGSEERTGFSDLIRNLKCPMINIDHHATNEGFADYDHVDTSASSTCQIVYYLLVAADMPMDADVAEKLYLGLITDSRHFQNSNVCSETFYAAAHLFDTGINHTPIIKRLTQSRTFLDLKVLGMGLTNFRTAADGNIAYAVLTRDELESLGATHRHAWSAGLFGYLISLASAVVAICIVESEDGRVFCEFRAKDGFDVSRIALHFGGGGHRGASGCSQFKPVPQFLSEVLEKTEENLKEYLNS